ncbi:hypothetical protein [Brevibacillus parabrevis]|uniref:hypothetical protein n=1 Tax=Brevibacillus parabrevis TaxID=54914 RepID=UPI0028D32D9F|nr:hypothetical protein [Brevibacillus parabrevis]MED1724605.1 hypothetical protein [Brevibacillus parabrevis]
MSSPAPDLTVATGNIDYGNRAEFSPTIKIPHPYYEWRKRLDFLADTFEQQPKKEQWLSEYAKKQRNGRPFIHSICY